MTGVVTLQGGPRDGERVAVHGPRYYTRERNVWGRERPRLGLYLQSPVYPGMFDWKGWQ